MSVFSELLKLWPDFKALRSSVREEKLLSVLEEQEEKHRRRRREARMEQERAQVPVGRKPGLQLQPASVRCPFGGL